MQETENHPVVTHVRERMEEGFLSTLQHIEEPTISGIRLYIMIGVPVGGFLFGCLSNDFLKAIALADLNNMRYLQDIATMIYNYLPSNSHGSQEIVHKWVELDGIIGQHSNQEAR